MFLYHMYYVYILGKSNPRHVNVILWIFLGLFILGGISQALVHSWIWSVSAQLVNFLLLLLSSFAVWKFLLLLCWGTDVIRVCSSHGEGLFDSG